MRSRLSTESAVIEMGLRIRINQANGAKGETETAI